MERIQSEPFTVRELVILSPYRADRSAVGMVLSSRAALVGRPVGLLRNLCTDESVETHALFCRLYGQRSVEGGGNSQAELAAELTIS